MSVPEIQRVFDAQGNETHAEPAKQWILVVEDDTALRQSILTLLSSENRAFIDVNSAASAIEHLRTRSFDLILLDYHLPDMPGLAVMEWLKDESRNESVIMVSGEESIEAAIHALRRGADDFLRKPFHPDQLRRAVSSSLQKIALQRANHAMRQRLEESERLHRYLVEHSLDLIYTLSAEGTISYINTRIESMLGYRRDEMIGQPYEALLWTDDRERARHIFRERRTGKRASANIELRLKRNLNDDATDIQPYVTVALNAMGMYLPNNRKSPMQFLGTYGVARDISERKRAEEIITFQAYHDQMTQLPNRVLFKDRLDLAIAQAQRRDSMIGVMFIDVDRFKLINDTFGHAEGDELLRNIAQRIKRCLRRGDTLARQGGDEFTVLLPDLCDRQDAQIIATKMLDELKQSFAIADTEFRATVSIGIAIFPDDGTTAEELAMHADIAMYQVKARGKNNYNFFDPQRYHTQSHRITLENELSGAIDKNEFVLEYQPKFSVASKRFTGVEALLRWQHPTHGLIAPTSFIAVAEECGLIQPISKWVIDEACAQLARWQKEGHAKLRMAFNLSPKDLETDGIIDTIIETAARYDVPLNLLDIEITENVLLKDAEDIALKLRRLRELGAGISIDDFGTGYSSLAYLQKFPVNCLKIDRCFVRELTKHSLRNPIISAISGVAKGFNLHIVAEGVETEEQVNALRSFGCDEMQGYYFGKPVPAVHITDKLDRQRQGFSGPGGFLRTIW